MKIIVLATLLFTISSSFAAEMYGGVSFHSSVPVDQMNIMKSDIDYLYKKPVIDPDIDFLKLADIPRAEGPYLHNWLLNRMRFIISENFDLNKNLTRKFFHRFPKTPNVDLGKLNSYSEVAADEASNPTIIMSNTGGLLYITGKRGGTLLGLKYDDQKIMAPSTRVGIVQIGAGLFLERFMINDQMLSSANTISRLGTYFHEARHSDGNSKHTGFVHEKCPLTHPYAGYAACEKSANGSYSIGAYSERHFYRNCTDCSTADKGVLAVRMIDSINRIVNPSFFLQRAQLETNIKSYQGIVDSFENNLRVTEDETQRKKYERQIEMLKSAIVDAKAELERINALDVPVLLDATPEGDYKVLSLVDTMKTMEPAK